MNRLDWWRPGDTDLNPDHIRPWGGRLTLSREDTIARRVPHAWGYSAGGRPLYVWFEDSQSIVEDRRGPAMNPTARCHVRLEPRIDPWFDPHPLRQDHHGRLREITKQIEKMAKNGAE